jgi:hypothetical protein
MHYLTWVPFVIICCVSSGCSKAQSEHDGQPLPTSPAGASVHPQPQQAIEEGRQQPSDGRDLNSVLKLLAELRPHYGANLRELQDNHVAEVVKTLQRVMHPADWPNKNLGLHYVWAVVKENKLILYLLLESQEVVFHPGSTIAHIEALDEAGKVISRAEFSTGHRCYLQDAKLEAVDDADFPIIAIKTGLGGGPGQNVGVQYYGMIGSRFDLIRLENRGGIVTRNVYYIKHFMCGPRTMQQAESAWEQDILSSDRLRILRALTWLGGNHRNVEGQENDNPELESTEAVALVRRVRKAPRVISRLEELARSPDGWIAEQARLARDPADVDPRGRLRSKGESKSGVPGVPGTPQASDRNYEGRA